MVVTRSTMYIIQYCKSGRGRSSSSGISGGGGSTLARRPQRPAPQLLLTPRSLAGSLLGTNTAYARAQPLGGLPSGVTLKARAS